MSQKLLARFALMMLGAVSLAACAVGGKNPPSDMPAGGSSIGSGIAGLVLIGPVGPPVYKAVDTPTTQPYAATLSIRTAQDDREVAKVQSRSDGVFRVALAPGNYRIVPQSPNPGAPPYAEPITVKITEGKYVSVTVTYDSGIR